jgi:hypothetical protein
MQLCAFSWQKLHAVDAAEVVSLCFDMPAQCLLLAPFSLLLGGVASFSCLVALGVDLMCMAVNL